MKTVIITQARIGSSRFPSKVLQTIDNESLLAIHLSRLKDCKLAANIIVATTYEHGVAEILNIANAAGVVYYQGDLSDVLDRFYKAAGPYKADFVVRVTSDCPLIDAQLIDEMIEKATSERADYLTNTFTPGFPDGQDIEVIKWNVLELAWKNAKLKSEREHVTPFIRKNTDIMGGSIFSGIEFPVSPLYGDVRMTVDESPDKDAIEILIRNLGLKASWKEYADFVRSKPALFENQKIVRNEGYIKSLENDNEN